MTTTGGGGVPAAADSSDATSSPSSTDGRAAGPGIIRAAGVVVLRRAAVPPEWSGSGAEGLDGLEVLAVHRPRYQDWSLPKGKIEPGETPLAAAVREVREETGVRTVPGRSLATTRYLEPDGRAKSVQWWLGSVAREYPRDPDAEVDEVRWLRAAGAGAVLTHPMDDDLLAGVAGLLDRGGAVDAAALLAPPLILLRHASARSRKSWDGPELERPLDPAGLAQAEALVEILGALGPSRITSSSARRCRQTVQPFADAAGLIVELDPELTEQAFDADADRPLRAVRRLAGERAAGPVLVCTHRPVLGPLLGDATGRSWARGAEKALRTAELAVLTGPYHRMSLDRYATPPPG